MTKNFTLVLGMVLLAVGILGVVTGGHNHKLIIFGINASHNIVHIVSGLLAILATLKNEDSAKMYCLVFGAVYGVVTIAGLLHVAFVVNLLNLNKPDHLLHFLISAACLWVGLQAKKAA